MPQSSSRKAAETSHQAPPRELVDFVASLPEAALLTRDRWEAGAVEIVFANSRFCALTGFEPEHLAGQSTRILHGKRTDLNTLTLGRGGRVPVSGENWLHRRDGTEFFALWRTGNLLPGWLVLTYHDLSEMKRLQDALLHSEKLSTVGQLAGGVAHDFNNLLSIINGYCEIMRGKLGAAHAAQKDLQEIHRAGQKAATISRQLLEFSRRQETESSVVNANTLIREIAEILRRVMGEGVHVELRLASDLGNMRADPTQFQQALLNLCFNSRDAMPQGGKLQVRTYRADLSGEEKLPAGAAHRAYVVAQVMDTGTGMDPEMQKHVFQSFYTTKPHGTGLGLSTVQNIVRRAGGFVRWESAVGRGTTFELYFPETAEAEQIFSTTLSALPSTSGTESLWLIEEDEVLRKMVSGILSVDGYQVRTFATAREALEADGSHGQLQLLLLDNTGSEACQLAQQLHGANPKMRALFLAVDSPSAVLKNFPARAVAHLPKPFALSTLLRTVRRLLDQGRKRGA
jgi:PAS domain S-box-containing protein